MLLQQLIDELEQVKKNEGDRDVRLRKGDSITGAFFGIERVTTGIHGVELIVCEDPRAGAKVKR